MNGAIMSSSSSVARHFFVVNPVSFYRTLDMEAVIEKIHHFFKKSEESAAEYAVHISRFPRNAISAIHRFADAAPSDTLLRVYAVGGDGILFDCLNGVVGLPNVELGIIPYGRTNNFYRIFGQENKDPFHSLEIQTRAPSAPMDVLYCGSNYALSDCTIGLSALNRVKIKKTRERYPFLDRFTPNFIHAMSSVFGCLDRVMNPEIFRQNYRVWIDDQDRSGVHALIHIANSPWYTDGASIIPEAVPSDGLLNVLTCRSVGKVASFLLMNKHLNGERLSAKKVFITSSSPLIFTLDGEIFYDKYITVEIKPGIVRIINPTLKQE
jgi:diacylglycerol kinase family enzyme